VPLDYRGAFDDVRAGPVLLDREIGADAAVHVGEVVALALALALDTSATGANRTQGTLARRAIPGPPRGQKHRDRQSESLRVDEEYCRVGFQNVAIVADQRFQAAVPWDREGPHLAAAGRNMWIAEAAR
jgi:hypothetical protein